LIRGFGAATPALVTGLVALQAAFGDGGIKLWK
jgi:hypothetical protein